MAETAGDAHRKLPSVFAAKYVKALLGYGVAVAVCAGAVNGKIPGLDVPMNLFPVGSRRVLTVVSALMIGVVPLVIEFLIGERLRRSWLRKTFRFAAVFFAASLILMFALFLWFAEEISIRDGASSATVIVGPASGRIYGPPCGCDDTDGPKTCIKKLGISDEAALETCWEAGSIKLGRNLLQATCFLVMTGLDALVGLFLLRRETRTHSTRRRRRPAANA